MKHCCLYLFLLVSGHLYAQLIRVPVGYDSAVASFPYIIYNEDSSCPNQLDTCVYSMNGLCSYDTIRYVPLPAHYTRSVGWFSDSIYIFTPVSIEEQLDTLYGFYANCTGCPDNNACHGCPLIVLERKILHVVGYYDGNIRPRMHHLGAVYFIHENGQLRQPDWKKMTIYNNSGDTITCSDFGVDISPSLPIKVNIYEDSTVTNSVVIPPYSISSLDVAFMTTASAADSVQWGGGFVRMNAQSSSRDTLLLTTDLINFAINFQLMDVDEPKDQIIPLAIYPNPTTGTYRILYRPMVSSTTSLVIVSELGSIIQTLHSGSLEAGEHKFESKLPIGLYYLRLQTGNTIFTRKLIVVE